MLRAATVTTLAALGAFGAFMGFHAATANAERTVDNGLGEYQTVILDKTGRIPLEEQEEAVPLEEEATIEWVIDCYDQYGPEADKPDATALARCIPS